MAESAYGEAHGRVNLIGEHTDYHEGFVLPMLIPQCTRARMTLRSGSTVRVWSDAFGGTAEDYEVGHEAPGRGWLDYVQGVTAMLARSGARVHGFDVRIESNVPVGAGVASSAALEVSLLRGLRTLFDLDLDDIALAKMAQSVETVFVGAPIGIMDQMAASIARPGAALFIDTRSLAVEHVPLPLDLEIAVIDSGISHAHATGDYAARRRESFAAAAALGVATLRDLDRTDLPRIAALSPILARRATHVVTENARVLEAVDALRSDDLPRIGALFNASHASMRDDYQTSTPEIDLLVTLADDHPDIYGARLTGGGFGGSVIAAAKAGVARDAAVQIADEYGRLTGRRGSVVVPP
jgi:galactokinase